jgi:hypothetical protein
MAMALRPRSSAATINSRYGSQALALGARCGAESVDTTRVVAGFDVGESVDTFAVVAGFGGHARGRPPRRRIGTPAALR